MEEDLSKKTILVFLVLTIFVSALSTWTLLENVSDIKGVEEPTASDNKDVQGEVSVTVDESPQSHQEGKISLKVNEV